MKNEIEKLKKENQEMLDMFHTLKTLFESGRDVQHNSILAYAISSYSNSVEVKKPTFELTNEEKKHCET